MSSTVVATTCLNGSSSKIETADVQRTLRWRSSATLRTDISRLSSSGTSRAGIRPLFASVSVAVPVMAGRS
jgi:hypothetical protein